MRVRPTELPEVLLVEPVVRGDARGFFLETYHAAKYREAGIALPFVQDNHSRSAPGILRGLHAQLGEPLGKLVRCVRGAIFDVAVDMRRGSPTYGRHVSLVLNAADGGQMFVPKGFAHGFCTLEPDTEVVYKVTALYAPQCDKGIAFDDPDLGIAWPIAPADAVLSDKDRRHPRLRDLPAHFTYAAS